MNSSQYERGGLNSGPRPSATVYDFRTTEKLSIDQSRFLNKITKVFSESVITRLSPILKNRISMGLASSRTITYGEYISSLSDPTPMIVLSLQDGGRCFVDLDYELSMGLFEKLMGGRGQVFADHFRPFFTEIEKTVLNRPFNAIVEAFNNAWADVNDLNAQKELLETNPSSVYICNPSDMVVALQYQIEFGKNQGVLGVCIPFSFIREALPKSSFDEFMINSSNKVVSDDALLFPEAIHGAKIPIEVHLGSSSIPFQDLLYIQVGDMIRLDTEIGQPLRVKVNSQTKFLGQPGIKDSKMASKIIKVLDEGDEEYE